MRVSGWKCAVAMWWCVAAMVIVGASRAQAATIFVAAGGDLQAALDAAQPGDTILLQEGAEFVGSFILRVKPAGDPITVRSSAPDSLLPRPGERIAPAHAPLLARIRSGSSGSALRTAPGASGWRLQYLDFAANNGGYGDLMQIGDGSSNQNTLASVPRGFVLQHLYVHGDPMVGQKRCIALNAADVTIRDSYIAECKTVGQDSQAIGGWNGPGPYVIENNYIEGAGENFLLGGAVPGLKGVIPDGVTFRRNHVARPMSWRLPIIPEPQSVTAVASTGGSLAAGTYAYRIIARRIVGQGNMGRSTATPEVTATVGTGGAVRIRWAAVAGAEEYQVYGRTAGGQAMYWRVTGTEFVDDGRAGTSGNVPTSIGTVWLVKNLFELKNARNVIVEDNIFENHWVHAQAGYAIVLTPRNSGGCDWCLIEDVRFERNIVRNVSAGFNILGYDSPLVSGQARRIVLRNNLVYGVNKSLGGNAWFMILGDEPGDLTIDHNTIDFEGTTLVNVYGGSSTAPRPVEPFVMTNNATKHGKYGMGGSYFAYGNDILANFYPGSLFTGNYLAGGSASRYPVGNYFAGTLEEQVVDAAAGNYRLRADSVLRGLGTDGLDIGADIDAIANATAGVIDGRPSGMTGNLPPSASFTASCTDLACTFTNTSRDADGPLASWNWTFGDGATSSQQQAAHTFAAGGTYVVTLTVTDSAGLTATASMEVTLTAANAAPMAKLASSCAGLVCTFTDASVDADGRIVERRWNFGDGGTGSAATETHQFAAPGTYSVSLDVTDDRGATGHATASVTLGGAVHVGSITGDFRTWKSYWAAEMVLSVHDANERPVAGATVALAWTGAVSKTDSCVTNESGQCRVDSGTLSAKRPSVTLTVTGISAASSTYTPSANHGAGASLTVELPPPPPPGVHVGRLTGEVTTWRTYWSTDMVLSLHDDNETPVAGATVGFEWTGAVAKSASCVTNEAGQCTVKSGTLSAKRSLVTLTVTSVWAPTLVYAAAGNHDVPGPGAAITMDLSGVSVAPPTSIEPAAHIGALTGGMTTWNTYWNTEVVLTVHDEMEQPLAGAAVAFEWTGAVVQPGACVTNEAGQCTVDSGTLSQQNARVTLTVTAVSAPSRTYNAAGNHHVPGPGAAITLNLADAPPPPLRPGDPAVHVGGLTGTTTAWNTYWGAEMVVTVHDENEAPVAGATVAGAWTGAVTKDGSCVTDAAGQCTMPSGTLSGYYGSVTLTITDVSDPVRRYNAAAAHGVPGEGAVITLTKPL